MSSENFYFLRKKASARGDFPLVLSKSFGVSSYPPNYGWGTYQNNALMISVEKKLVTFVVFDRDNLNLIQKINAFWTNYQ